MTYYVISTSYIGPNQHTTNDAKNILDGDYYDICTYPGSTNQSKEVRIEGWLGSTNDWSLTAHGKFETIEAAREKIADEIGRPVTECRTTPAGDEYDRPDGDDVVERYYVSPYSGVCDADSDDVTADTTDEQIAAMVAEGNALAEKEGFLIIGDAVKWLTEVRDWLKAEADDEAA